MFAGFPSAVPVATKNNRSSITLLCPLYGFTDRPFVWPDLLCSSLLAESELKVPDLSLDHIGYLNLTTHSANFFADPIDLKVWRNACLSTIGSTSL